jgi:hypothetical protein
MNSAPDIHFIAQTDAVNTLTHIGQELEPKTTPAEA